MLFKSLLPHFKSVPVPQKLTFQDNIHEIVPVKSLPPHNKRSSFLASVFNPQLSPHIYTHFHWNLSPTPRLLQIFTLAPTLFQNFVMFPLMATSSLHSRTMVFVQHIGNHFCCCCCSKILSIIYVSMPQSLIGKTNSK